ncbi:hypothetical protein, partial [Naasia sp. SYSU D00057]|uniref:hypothetical protein n=1 Tax=Naasia sp. SYSU D00057 TaxID=2817380 RepID=UPI001B30F499
GVLLRGLWAVVVVVVLALLGGVGGFVGGSARGAEFTSEARLAWDPAQLRVTDASAYAPDVLSLEGQSQQQAVRLMSDAVLVPVSESLGVDLVDLRETFAVSVDGNLLTVRGQAASADAAQAQVQAVLDSYVTAVSSGLANDFSAQAALVQVQIDQVRAALGTVGSGDPLASGLSTQLAGLISQQALLTAKAAAVPSPVDVLEPASLPAEPSSASAVTLGIVGAGLGFLVGVAVLLLMRFVRLRGPARP